MRRAHTATARCSQHTPRFSSSTTFLRHTSQETGGKVIADPTLAESPASPGPRQELYHVGDGSPGGNDPVAQRRGLLDGRGSIEAHPRHILWDDHGGALNGPLYVLCRFLSRQPSDLVLLSMQEGAAGAPQPRHMTPCACHCAACLAAGHGNACQCVEIRRALLRRFGKADVVDLILQHYYGACGWGTARFDAGIHCVQHGPAGDVVAASDSDGRIHLICAHTGETSLCPLRGHGSDVNSVSWSPDGTRLASGSLDAGVLIWDAASGEQLCSLTGHTDMVTGVCFDPTGKTIVSCSLDKTIRFWDSSTGAAIGSPVRCDSGVLSVAYSADGTKLAAGLGDPEPSVVVFNTQTNEQICSLRGHRYAPSLSKECFLSFG